MKLIPKNKGGSTIGSYSQSEDSNLFLPDWMIKTIDTINGWFGWQIPTGASNCTLYATNGKYSKANTILKGNTSYKKIDKSKLKKGSLVIATNPNNNAHHTMIYEGVAKNPGVINLNGKKYNYNAGDIIVSYSTGSTYDGLRKNIPLNAYLDLSNGKTQVDYFDKE